MKVKVQYEVSKEAQARILVETGKRPDWVQYIEIDMVYLTQEQRAEVVYIKGLSDSRIDLSAPRTTVRKPYSDELDWKKWLDSKKNVKFDHTLTVEEAVNLMLEYAGQMRELEPEAQARVAELKAEYDAKAEYATKMKAERQVILGQGEGLAGDEDALRSIFRKVGPDELWDWKENYKDKSLASRFYDTYLKPIVDAREKAEKEAREAEAEAEKLAWIELYGSERLKLAIKHKHPIDRIYAIERASSEHPGWDIDFYDDAEWDDRTNPTLGELQALEEAIKRTDLVVRLVWLKAPGRNTPRDDRYYDYDNEEFDPCPALIMRRFLGKYDLIKEL